MDPIQLVIVLAGLVVSSGGVFMLYRAMRSESVRARGPYVPLAITFMGLMIAYMAYTNYQALDPLDFLIMALFVLTLLSLLGIQFFIVDRHRRDE